MMCFNAKIQIRRNNFNSFKIHPMTKRNLVTPVTLKCLKISPFKLTVEKLEHPSDLIRTPLLILANFSFISDRLFIEVGV